MTQTVAEPSTEQPEERARDPLRFIGPILMPLMLIVLARQILRPVSDPDTFWHLRLGDMLIEQGRVASPDWGTQHQRDWVLTQWLAEVVMALAERLLGLPGVMVLFGLMLMSLVVLVYRLCRLGAGVLASSVVTAVCTVAMAASISPRPHMVTYVLLAVSLASWVRATRTRRAPWMLVPLTWVWAMSHGMWFVGPLTGFVVCLGLFLDGDVDRRRLGRMTLVPVASLAAAALTPVGPALLMAPLAVGGVGMFVTEWQAASFRELGPGTAAVMIALVVVGWARARQRIGWVYLLLLCFAAGWMLLAARTVTLGAIIAAPLLAAVIDSWLPPRREPRVHVEWLPIAATAVAIVGVMMTVLPRVAGQAADAPSGLSPALEALPDGASVLNAYDVGGWLRWAHPDLDPLIDGLTEAYSVQELSQYGGMISVQEGWQHLVGDTGAQVALLPDGSPLATALQERQGWQAVDADAGYVLLTQND